MAPKKGWDVQRDNMLFMLLVDHISVNWNHVAKKWTEKYPDDESPPTGSAISQHITKLKKGNGPNSGLGAASKSAASMATPVKMTGNKRSAPKTPSSSAKRARTTTSRMSDEDDSNDEKTLSFNPLVKRETPSRRTLAARKNYREESDEEEEDTGEALDQTTSIQATAAPAPATKTVDTFEAALSAVPRDSVQAHDTHDLLGGPRKPSFARFKGNPPKSDHSSREQEPAEDDFVPMV